MEKLNMQTTDVVDENIKRIGEMFPNCLTEVKDEKGRPQVAIDFDQLRQRIMGSLHSSDHFSQIIFCGFRICFEKKAALNEVNKLLANILGYQLAMP